MSNVVILYVYSVRGFFLYLKDKYAYRLMTDVLYIIYFAEAVHRQQYKYRTVNTHTKEKKCDAYFSVKATTADCY